MDSLAQDPLTRFIGYGINTGRAMGTLKHAPNNQLIETPVAENLMAGLAIGLALKGLKPIVFLERFDFILNALDAIVNHLDKINTISFGQFCPTIILRIVVGNKLKPLFTGDTHTQNLEEALSRLVSFPVVHLSNAMYIQNEYAIAHAALSHQSTALIEFKDQL